MSSVVISGDTSGAITLAAPAIAGTNTLSLPAQTATIATLTTPSFATTIGVGGATAAASGAGITFPASQSASSDANTLDDYEEGTFTPTIRGGTTAGTASYNRQSGIYTKIGNRVFFTIALTWSSGTGTGALAIGGLPFTQDGGGFDIPYAVSENGDIAWDANYMPTPIGLHNTTLIYLNASRVGASGSSVNTNYDAAGGFSVSGHYRIA